MGKISASWRDLGGVMQNKTEDSKTCTGVMISARAYTSILAEALSRDPLETGGILLGHYKSGIWYIVEATDPGVETFHSEIQPPLSGIVAHLQGRFVSDGFMASPSRVVGHLII